LVNELNIASIFAALDVVKHLLKIHDRYVLLTQLTIL